MTTVDSAAFDALVRQIETELVSNSNRAYAFSDGLFPEFGESQVRLIASSWNAYYIELNTQKVLCMSATFPTVAATLKFLYEMADPTKYMIYEKSVIPRGIYDALYVKKIRETAEAETKRAADAAAAETKQLADAAAAETKRAVEQSVRVGELCKPLVAAPIQNQSSTKSAVKSQTWKCAQCNEELYGFIHQYHVDVVRAGNKQSEIICAACFSQEN